MYHTYIFVRILNEKYGCEYKTTFEISKDTTIRDVHIFSVSATGLTVVGGRVDNDATCK